MSRRVRPWGLLIVVLLLLAPALSSAQSEGVVQGRVVNGTQGGGSMEGLQVTLRVFRGGDQAGSLSAVTDAQGEFRFDGLETASDWAYLAQTDYRDVVYSSGLLGFEPDQAQVGVEIPAYETTGDDAGITIGRAHILIDITDPTGAVAEGLLVAELYVFSNPGDRTFVGTEEVQGRRAVSRFLVPEGARDLSFSDGQLGGRFLATEGGFVDTEPLWPGTTTVMFHYALGCPGGRCDLTRTVTHRISDLNLLIADSGAQVDSNLLTFDRRVSTEDGGSYLSYAGHDLAAGDRLSVSVQLPQGTSMSGGLRQRTGTAWPWIILGTVMTTLVLGYPFWRDRVQASARAEASADRR